MSAINSVASSYVPSLRPEAMEPPGRDTRNDHDKDDAGAAAVSTPVATVNTQGQSIGTVLNTRA